MEKDLKEILDDNTRLKYEIASELGLTEKIKKHGWKGLTAKETGKIGGILKSKLSKNVTIQTLSESNVDSG